MRKLGNWIFEGLSTDIKPVAHDGNIFKELDSGDTYTRVAGVWTNLDAGLSFVKATKSGRITTDGEGYYAVTFATPFTDANYTVALSTGVSGEVSIASFKNLTKDGFEINSYNAKNCHALGEITVSWLVTRNYDPTI